MFVARLWIKGDRHEFTLQGNIATHHQTSFPTTLPQLSSPPNAFGELAAMRSSMRCRPRIGRETVVGVIVICELSLEISTITEAPTVIPRESTIDFGSRTPWLFPQRCNVVFMRGSIARGYTRSNGKFFRSITDLSLYLRIAGETCQLIRVKWRGESTRKANR